MLFEYAEEFLYKTIPDFYRSAQVQTQVENFYFLLEFVQNFASSASDLISLDFESGLRFDSLQKSLILIFTTILFFNSVAIYYYWKVHGATIVKKCKKGGTRKLIEELKRSVELLKLPKIHSPRI